MIIYKLIIIINYKLHFLILWRHSPYCTIVLSWSCSNCLIRWRPVTGYGDSSDSTLANLDHYKYVKRLTLWHRVTYICVSKLTTNGSDTGLPAALRQVIIWTKAGILSIEPKGTQLSEIFKNMHMKLSSGNWRPFYLGLDVLIQCNKHNRGSQLKERNTRAIP